MLKFSAPFVGVAIALVMALPSAAEDLSAGTVLASVNGEDITVGHLVAARVALPEQYQALPDDILFEGLIEQLIQQTVLSQALTEVSQSIELQLENDRRTVIAGAVLDDVVADAVTDEALQEAYDAAYADAEPTPEYNAAHILVETEDEAKALITELEGGAEFAELAKERSTGPSGPNGGALGWFSEGMMVKPFEDAVLMLEPGQISPPVETQFGWHVLILNETRMKGAPPLEEVRDELAEAVEATAVEEAVAQLMEAATIDRADITDFDPAVLRDETLLK